VSNEKPRWRLRPAAVLALAYKNLDIELGLLLGSAGALKAQQLIDHPTIGHGGGIPRPILIFVASFELIFALWLLAGLYRRTTRWLCLFWFTCLAAAAMAQAMGGVGSCACFGDLHAHPWFMFFFDVAIVGLLWAWRPNDRCFSGSTSLVSRLPLVLVLACLVVACAYGLMNASSNKPFVAEIVVGNATQNGKMQENFRCVNDCGEIIALASLEPSCPCLSVSLERLNVPPGHFLEGTVTLDLGRRPEFVGDLSIIVKGLSREGRVVALLKFCTTVYPSPPITNGSISSAQNQ
jgi:hypothetical protein